MVFWDDFEKVELMWAFVGTLLSSFFVVFLPTALLMCAFTICLLWGEASIDTGAFFLLLLLIA